MSNTLNDPLLIPPQALETTEHPRAATPDCASAFNQCYESITQSLNEVTDDRRLTQLRLSEMAGFVMISLRGFTTMGLFNTHVAIVYGCLMIPILYFHHTRTHARDRIYLQRARDYPNYQFNTLTSKNPVQPKALNTINITALSAYGACFIDSKTSQVWAWLGLFESVSSRAAYLSLDLMISLYAYYYMESYEHQRRYIKECAIAGWLDDFFMQQIDPTRQALSKFSKDVLQQQFTVRSQSSLQSYQWVRIASYALISMAVLATDLLGAFSITPHRVFNVLAPLVTFIALAVISLIMYRNLKKLPVFHYADDAEIQRMIDRSYPASTRQWHYYYRCMSSERWVLSFVTLRAFVDAFQLADALLCAHSDRGSFQFLTTASDQTSDALLYLFVIGLPLLRLFVSGLQSIEQHAVMKESMIKRCSAYLAVPVLHDYVQQQHHLRLTRDEKHGYFAGLCLAIHQAPSWQRFIDDVNVDVHLKRMLTAYLVNSDQNWSEVHRIFQPHHGYALTYAKHQPFIDDDKAFKSINTTVEKVVAVLCHPLTDHEALLCMRSSTLQWLCEQIGASQSIPAIKSVEFPCSDLTELIDELDDHAQLSDVKAAFDLSNPDSAVCTYFNSCTPDLSPVQSTLFAQVSQYVTDHVQAWTAVFSKR